MKPVGVAFLFVALVALVGCTGEMGDQGTQGPAGTTGATGITGVTGVTGPTGVFEGDASISAVVPDVVFVGRKTWITIAGFNTQWASDPDIALNLMFCDGVTYDPADIIVASPTALVVPISVSAIAQLGSCELKVAAYGETLTFSNGFALKSPLSPLAAAGDFKQGSIAIVQVQNLDFDNPFDTTTDENGFYTNIAFAPSGGVGYIPLQVEPFSMIVQVNMDVTATAGTKQLRLRQRPRWWPGGVRAAGGLQHHGAHAGGPGARDAAVDHRVRDDGVAAPRLHPRGRLQPRGVRGVQQEPAGPAAVRAAPPLREVRRHARLHQ